MLIRSPIQPGNIQTPEKLRKLYGELMQLKIALEQHEVSRNAQMNQGIAEAADLIEEDHSMLLDGLQELEASLDANESSRDQMIQRLDEKIAEVDAIIKKTEEIDSLLERAEMSLEHVLSISVGAPGEPGAPGSDAIVDYDFVLKEIAKLIPAPIQGENGKDGKRGPKGAAGEDAVVDIKALTEAVISSMASKKIKKSQIDGWQDPEEVLRRFIARGSLHGGGDTVRAGTNVTITRNADGTVTVSSTGGGSSTTKVRDEDASSLTLAHTPIANTLQLFRGGTRQSVTNGDYTIVGAVITLTKALKPKETLTADYEY